MKTNLYMAVISQFASVAEFGRKLGWTRRKANDIVRGRQNPTLDEAQKIMEILGMNNAQDCYNLFFAK